MHESLSLCLRPFYIYIHMEENRVFKFLRLMLWQSCTKCYGGRAKVSPPRWGIQNTWSLLRSASWWVHEIQVGRNGGLEQTFQTLGMAGNPSPSPLLPLCALPSSRHRHVAPAVCCHPSQPMLPLLLPEESLGLSINTPVISVLP